MSGLYVTEFWYVQMIHQFILKGNNMGMHKFCDKWMTEYSLQSVDFNRCSEGTNWSE